MEIGSTISHTTLRRIFESEISHTVFSDLRFLKTLDKLCIFLGYKNLETYLLINAETFRNESENKDLEICRKIIQESCKTEFEILQTMPDYKIDKLLKYTFTESNYRRLTESYMERLKKENFSFDFNYKKAGFEIISIETLVNSEEFKIFRTKEHWDLIFRSPEKSFVHEVYNNRIYYFKIDRNNTWKIWNVYNPNFDNLI